MDLQGTKLNELSQTEKDIYHMISLSMKNLKKMNKQNRNKLRDTENIGWLPYGRGFGE